MYLRHNTLNEIGVATIVTITVMPMADKIANLSDIVASPPSGWTHERRTAYLEWSNSVIAGCRGHNDPLEALYDWVADEVAGALKRAS